MPKLTLNKNGLVVCDPPTPQLQGLWPEVLAVSLERQDIEYRFGDIIDNVPMTKADAEFLYKSVCRDEVLIRLCANLIVENRKTPTILPDKVDAALSSIIQHLKSRGRLI